MKGLFKGSVVPTFVIFSDVNKSEVACLDLKQAGQLAELLTRAKALAITFALHLFSDIPPPSPRDRFGKDSPFEIPDGDLTTRQTVFAFVVTLMLEQ